MPEGQRRGRFRSLPVLKVMGRVVACGSGERRGGA
jgi:hypothetical protein